MYFLNPKDNYTSLSIEPTPVLFCEICIENWTQKLRYTCQPNFVDIRKLHLSCNFCLQSIENWIPIGINRLNEYRMLNTFVLCLVTLQSKFTFVMTIQREITEIPDSSPSKRHASSIIFISHTHISSFAHCHKVRTFRKKSWILDRNIHVAVTILILY
jgi:hypothetical protein